MPAGRPRKDIAPVLDYLSNYLEDKFYIGRISKASGFSEKSIRKGIIQLRLPIQPKGSPKGIFRDTEIKRKLAAADWTKRDCDLAVEFNITREYIRQLRKHFGQAKTYTGKSRSRKTKP